MNVVSTTASRPWFLNHCPPNCCHGRPQPALVHALTNRPRKCKQGPVTVVRGCCTSYWSRKMCSCCTLMRRSVSLNSYGMFQPNGPKFRLSCTSAWKKQRPYSSVLNSALKPNATPLIIHGWFKPFSFFLTSCTAVLSLSHSNPSNPCSGKTLVMHQG